MIRLFFAALLLALPVSAQAQTITVEKPWARATSPSAKAGGVFMTLTDTGVPDKLVSIATPIAEVAGLHRTVEQNGVMRMLPVEGLDLAPGKPVVFAPGGYHVMLMDLKRQLKPGDTFPITLTFAKAAPMTVTVKVEAAGAAGPSQDMHSGHAMHGTPPATKP